MTISDRKHSPLVLNIASPMAAGFAGCLLIGAVISWALISIAYEDLIKRQITAESTLLRKNVDRLKIVGVVDAIDFRLMQTADEDPFAVYLVTDRNNKKVTGNIETWPAVCHSTPENLGWRRFKTVIDGQSRPVLMRSEVIDNYYCLMVGRRMDASRRFLLSSGFTLLGVGLTTLFALIIISRFLGRRVMSRFRRINSAIDAFKGGDTRARTKETHHDEIGVLGERVNDMLDTLERQIAHLNEISRIMAHEFRTPLSQIKTNLTALDQDATNSERIEKSLVQLDGLLVLSRDLLEIAMHESVYAAPRKVIDLAEIVTEVVDAYEETTAAAGIIIETKLQQTRVLGEKWLLMRLVSNLMENAIEAAQCGEIAIATFESGAKSFLEISDNGSGVPCQTLDQLIDASEQLRNDATQETAEKNGIGLRIVRAVAVRHGAQIALLDKQPGLGIKISFARPPVE